MAFSNRWCVDIGPTRVQHGCYVAGGELLPGLSLLPEKPLRPAPWSRVKGGIWNPSNHRSRSIDQFNQSRRPMTPTPFSQSHSILTPSLDRGEQQVGDAWTVVGIWRYHRRSYTHDSLQVALIQDCVRNCHLSSFPTKWAAHQLAVRGNNLTSWDLLNWNLVIF